MTFGSVPWLELAVLVPLAGAPLVGRLRDTYAASRWCLAFTGAALGCSAAAWAGVELGPSAGEHAAGRLLVLDRLSAPLLPLVALLYFLTALATARTKMTRFSFAWLLAGESLALATFATADPWALALLLALATLPPYFELVRRGRPTRVYALHMALFVGLLLAGVGLTGAGRTASGAGVTMLAVLVRCGTLPAHVWVTDLFENCSFGTALLFVTPIAGLYAAVRLVLPVAPDWVLQWAGVASLATAVYAAGLAVVQHDARRYFAYLFVSDSSLVLVGLELHSAVSLTGALALWVAVALSVGGLGLTLRAIEARFGRLAFTDYRGLYDQSPSLAVCFLLTGLASVGFPGTLGFVAAELLVDGAVVAGPLVGLAVVAAGAINGIAVVRVYFLLFAGPRHASGVHLGITRRERAAVLSLAALIFAGGLAPHLHVASRHEAAERVLKQRAAFRGAPGH